MRGQNLRDLILLAFARNYT